MPINNHGRQSVTVLGATGSIGQSTLDVISRHTHKFSIYAITAFSRVDILASQIEIHQPKYAVVPDDLQRNRLITHLSGKNHNTQVLVGKEAYCEVASHDEVDIVMAAIVGAAGLLPTMAAVKASKKVLLANKEALVMSGEIFIDAVNKNGAQLLPIDSEHNAIFQCLPQNYVYGDKTSSGISNLILTGSGGSFRTLPLEQFEGITPEQACSHPNWNMGKKITIDSSSMMNKGLEFIEAKWLFGLAEQDIQVVIHPQSTIHSMVQYIDGSVIAQMGNPDMRTPIAHALAYPNRIISGVAPLDFNALSAFTFESPSEQRFPNLYLCIEACKQGQYATTALNAANEIAVEAFLNERISFPQIAQLNDAVLQKIEPHAMENLEDIVLFDKEARAVAEQTIKTRFEGVITC